MFSNEHHSIDKKVIFLKKLWVENEIALCRLV